MEMSGCVVGVQKRLYLLRFLHSGLLWITKQKGDCKENIQLALILQLGAGPNQSRTKVPAWLVAPELRVSETLMCVPLGCTVTASLPGTSPGLSVRTELAACHTLGLAPSWPPCARPMLYTCFPQPRTCACGTSALHPWSLL